MKTDLEFERAIHSTRLEMARTFGVALGVAIGLAVYLGWGSTVVALSVGFFVAFFVRQAYKPAHDVAWQKKDPEQQLVANANP